MSFPITLEFDGKKKFGKANTQASCTFYFDDPIDLKGVDYELGFSQICFRDYLIFNIGNLYLKFNGDTKWRKFEILAYDNEPLDHFFIRLNSEIVNYYAKLAFLCEYLNLKHENVNVEIDWNKVKLEGRWLDIFQQKINECRLNACPQFKQNGNLIMFIVPSNCLTMKFEGYVEKLFACNFEVYANQHIEFPFYSDFLNFIDYLHICVDILEEQRLNNTFEQLLATIAKNGSFNTTTERYYSDPRFIKIKSFCINSLTIKVLTSKKLDTSLANLALTLIFQPINNNTIDHYN